MLQGEVRTMFSLCYPLSPGLGNLQNPLGNFPEAFLLPEKIGLNSLERQQPPSSSSHLPSPA